MQVMLAMQVMLSQIIQVVLVMQWDVRHVFGFWWHSSKGRPTKTPILHSRL